MHAFKIMCTGNRTEGSNPFRHSLAAPRLAARSNPSLSAENPMQQAKLDHVVLWVADPLRSLEFSEKVVGLTPVRADEFRDGTAVSERPGLQRFDHRPDGQGRCADHRSHGRRLRHRRELGQPCLHRHVARRRRSAPQAARDAGVSVSSTTANSFGARGLAPEAFYFRDLTTTSSRRGTTSSGPQRGAIEHNPGLTSWLAIGFAGQEQPPDFELDFRERWDPRFR